MTSTDTILDACAAGEISPQVALSRLILWGAESDPGALAARAADAGPASPVAEVARLADRHRDRLASLRAIAAGGLDPEGADWADGVARLFDRLADAQPEAAVAFYSLGDPALLDAATAELVAVIERWSPAAGRRVLDFGCGIGRVAAALAPAAASVTGVDLSAAMVAQARARAGGAPRLRFERTDGTALPFPDGALDLVLAVDSFPFLVRGGPEAVSAQLAEFARVLVPGGDVLVFNWSYRGDDAADAAEAAALARAYGFALRRSGERPFAIWDAVGFQLTRR